MGGVTAAMLVHYTVTMTFIKNMKRFRLLILSMVAMFMLATPGAVYGTSKVKGEKTLGVTGGYATYNRSAYTNIFFQYTFVPHVRISTDVGYVFRHHDKSAFEISANMHFPFRIVSGLQVYPLAGVTFNNWNYHEGGNVYRFGADVGAGFDFYMTDYLKLTLQGKYSLMNKTSGAYFGLGIGYVF